MIVVHVSGFGQTGPRAAEAGFGSIGEAVGGIRHTTGDPDRPPARCGISLGDSLAALFAVIGTLAALHERAHERQGPGGRRRDLRSGRGTDGVDDGRLRGRPASSAAAAAVACPASRPRTRTRPPTARTILIAANADAVFAATVRRSWATPTLAADARFATHGARGEHADELDELISSWTARRSSAELLAAAAEAGVPAGRVYTAPDILADAHYAARGMVDRLVTRHGRDIPTPGVVPKFSRTPGAIASPGPALGAHTEEYQRRYPPRPT